MRALEKFNLMVIKAWMMVATVEMLVCLGISQNARSGAEPMIKLYENI